ncbi:hypothetical protein BC829DRAFT_385622 [Chytridium lagenaria]|nr:hypothetical protein BC829DRAFT_385622 [Chytridium lagenaria]
MTDGSGKGLPTPSSVAGQSAASLANSRIDELLTNILTLVCKLAKHDPKLPLIARLHGAVEYVVDILKRWHERKDSAGVSLALQTMKVFCNKAEVNVVAMQKKGALEVLANVLRGIPITAIKETNLMETLLELLTIFARSDNALKDMLRIFGTRFFVSLFSSTGYCESVQKCCLRLLRTIVDTEEGRKAFAQTDGIDVLTASLEMMALQSENSLSLQTTSAVNSIPSLLISVLRAAVSETDLPHLQLIRNRVSPLDAPSTGCYIDVSVRSTPSTDTFLRTRIRNRRPFSGISLHNTIHPFTIPTGESSTASIISTPPPSASSLSYLSNLVKDEPQDEEAEAFHLRSLCPEFDIVDRNGSLSIPPTTPLPLRPHKAVYPTNVLQPGAPLNVIRILEPLKPSPSAAGILNSAANVPLTSMSNAMVTTPPLNANEPLHPPPSSPASSSSSSHGASTVQPAICENLPECEPIQRRSTNAIRKTVFEQTTRILKPGMFTDLVVYDVMDDSVAKYILLFESKFESGNLQLAIKASDSEYDLILQTDIGSAPGKHNQWFYFSVTNMVVNQPYKFNIINMSKGHSQFAEGMQPVVYSVCNKVWRRGGDAVCFYNTDRHVQRILHSLLRYLFSAPRDILYVAYHYPYTVTDLSRFLNTLQLREIEPRNNLEPLVEIEKPPSNSPKFDDRCRRQTLCLSEGGNEVELLTITAFDRESLLSCPISGRVYIFLSSRVHPGESNSNYIMQGVIRFLMGDDDTASALRRACVFKIVPMLNPDGVINGSHRCGLAGIDLNREWRSPCKKRSPTIYWTKQLWKYIVDNGHRPLIACDFHGHSRKKNVFIFGCENVSGHAEGLEKIFPSLLASVSPLFDPNSCKYGIERSKEATARVVIWREMGVVGSYTLESTYCGADIGEKKGQQVQIQDLEKVGADFCCAILGAIHIFDGKVPVASAPSNKKESRQDSKDSSSSGDEK